jgi:hypothetical protein
MQMPGLGPGIFAGMQAANPVIASEAKQSRVFPRKQSGLLPRKGSS